MHVIATAGHVDHGKSTLVTALTGTDPDRLAAERRRGLSIELGYAWTVLPGDLPEEVAFVDVPGHERFLTTTLSGVGPVPAVLLVVAADDPWMPQAAEHLAAIDALGVSAGVVAVTRSDLGDPMPMMARARAEVDRTSLAGAPVVPVSAHTGAGLDQLRSELGRLVRSLPAPDLHADVRLWVDRCFTVRGAGTVVTGTLPAGQVRTGDQLEVDRRSVRVRSVQTLGRQVPTAAGVARVALNLSGADKAALDRHSVLVTPDAYRLTEVVDLRLHSTAGSAGAGDQSRVDPPRRPVFHIGAVAVPAYLRPLDTGPDVDMVRLTLERPLPLRVGDRALVRDPGSRQVWGAVVLDPAPPALRRRGAAGERAAQLAGVDETPDAVAEVERRGLVHTELLRRIGVTFEGSALLDGDVLSTPDGWLVSRSRVEHERARLRHLVREADERAEQGSEPGLALATLTERLALPSTEVTSALVAAPLTVHQGRVSSRSPRVAGALPARVEEAVTAVEHELRAAPFAAPTADRLAAVRLSPGAIATAAKAGRLLHLGQGVVLLPGADQEAARRLQELPQPFTTSAARERLQTSRRVILPLLAHLDRRGLTRRLPDDRRELVRRPAR